VGLRFGGQVEEIDTGRTLDFEPSAVFGLTVGRELSPETRIEGTWSHQSTSLDERDLDIRVDYLHVAGVYHPDSDRKSSGFVLVSAGVTLFDAAGTTDPSFSVGGGGRFEIGRGIALELEARLWGTLTSASGGVFCAGGCVVEFTGTGVFQLELSTGLVFEF
jgi:hypothetical protein